MASEQSDPKEMASNNTQGDGDHKKRTVAPEALVKHPLQNKWALWFFKNDKTKDWKDNLRVITSFDTVEDFWALYNHVQRASRLPAGCDYSLFKDGIEPMWEDEENKRGGRWLINLDKKQRHSDLDNFWLETLLCLVGESFEEHSDGVNGAVVQVRTRGDKLALWLKDCTNSDSITKIGRKIKERLSIPPKLSIGFQAHEDTSTKTGSTAKSIFSV